MPHLLNGACSDGSNSQVLWEDGERTSQLFRHLERRRARPESFLILEMRRTCAHKLTEHAGEMAWILKTDIESSGFRLEPGSPRRLSAHQKSVETVDEGRCRRRKED